MLDIHVPISPGELLDKITILRIKSKRMSDPRQLANVRRELEALESVWAACAPPGGGVAADIAALMAVNERLWVIEDEIRGKERAGCFDSEFIRLARAVYVENDERAAVKRRINAALGSSIVEEKSYQPY
jgi:hypothetical protein